MKLIRLGPSTNSSNSANIQFSSVSWKTDWSYDVTEGDRNRKCQDGEVIVQSTTAVVRMIIDGGDVDNVGNRVTGIMFSKKNSDTGG